VTNRNINIKQIEPAHAPDALSAAVVGALTRKMNPRLSFGPIKTLAFGLVSGGLIPLLVLPKLFRDFVIGERTHLWHFAEWLRLQFPGTETERFQHAITNVRFRWSPYVLSIILAALAVLWAWSELADMPPFEITAAFLFNFTARLPYLVASVPRVLIAAQGFTLLLIAAHVLSLWQIALHVRDVRGVVVLYNVVAKKHALGTIAPPRLELEWSALWIACMLAPAIFGAWWCVPMMLAASAQWRYINRTGRAMRLSLAANTFNVLAARMPHADVMLPTALQGKCTRDGCDKLLPVGSSFCPRCGARVAASADAEK
jgi:hypothetical protein